MLSTMSTIKTWIIGGLSLFILLCLIPKNLLATHQKCTFSSPYGMHSADCTHRTIKNVSDLIVPDNIEVLDLSHNYLRRLYNDSFSQYTSIKFLYLIECAISKIDAKALYPLSKLNTLDLTDNPLKKFNFYCPPSVYRLYLTRCNDLEEINVAGITSLEHLSLAACQFETLPDLGLLPNLVELNITDNHFTKITAADLVRFCNLKVLYIGPDNPFTDNLCDCLQLQNWTITHEISVQSFTCKYDKNVNLVCDLGPGNGTIEKYNACVHEYQFRKIPFVLLTAAGILAVVICLLVLLYVKYRRRDNKSVRRGKSHSPVETNMFSRDSTVKFVSENSTSILDTK